MRLSQGRRLRQPASNTVLPVGSSTAVRRQPSGVMHDQPDQGQRDRNVEAEAAVFFPFSRGRARRKPQRQRQTEQTPAADAHRQPNVIRRQVEDKAKHAKPLNQLTGLLAQMAGKASIAEMTCPALDTVSLEERNMQR